MAGGACGAGVPVGTDWRRDGGVTAMHWEGTWEGWPPTPGTAAAAAGAPRGSDTGGPCRTRGGGGAGFPASFLWGGPPHSWPAAGRTGDDVVAGCMRWRRPPTTQRATRGEGAPGGGAEGAAAAAATSPSSSGDSSSSSVVPVVGTCTCPGEGACPECVTVYAQGEDTKARAEAELLVPLTVLLMRVIDETEEACLESQVSGDVPREDKPATAADACGGWSPGGGGGWLSPVAASPDTVLHRGRTTSSQSPGQSSSALVDVLASLGEHEGLAWEGADLHTPRPPRPGSAAPGVAPPARRAGPCPGKHACLRMADPPAATLIYEIEEEACMGLPVYVARVFRYCGCSSSAYVVALIYLVRLLRREREASRRDEGRNPVLLTGECAHRLFMTSVVVAAKYLDDVYFSNEHYAKIAGLPLAELNALEIDFLFRIGFELRVNPYEYRRVRAFLRTARETIARKPARHT